MQASLASINATEDHPDKHPWREQEERDQQVKDVIHFLFRLLNDSGLLSGCSISHYDDISVGGLLSSWCIALRGWGITPVPLLLWRISRLLRGVPLWSIGVICRRNYKINKSHVITRKSTQYITPQPHTHGHHYTPS